MVRDLGNHDSLSEYWLLENLPAGWSWDRVLAEDEGEQDGFLIYGVDVGSLFIPLDLLRTSRRSLNPHGLRSGTSHERVVFRLFRFPCCGFLCCWVNPRVPSFCPECGTRAMKHELLAAVQVSDDAAVLELHL